MSTTNKYLIETIGTMGLVQASFYEIVSEGGRQENILLSRVLTDNEDDAIYEAVENALYGL